MSSSSISVCKAFLQHASKSTHPNENCSWFGLSAVDLTYDVSSFFQHKIKQNADDYIMLHIVVACQALPVLISQFSNRNIVGYKRTTAF